MSGIEIPDLPLEDFEPVIEDFDEIKDESKGSYTYAFIGVGQGGGRIAKAFDELGYHKCLAINTAKHDLNPLNLPEEQKFHMSHLGQEGAGKDREKGKAAFKKSEQEVFNKMRQVFGDNIDRIVICLGVAGGTGGGASIPLIETAKEYFTHLGKDNANERVGVIAALPTTGEIGSPQSAKNALAVTEELCERASAGEFAPLIIVDNDKIKKLYPKLTVAQFWPSVNGTVAGLFNIFNAVSTQESEYTSFDPVDYDSVMKSAGCMIFGVTAVPNFEKETAIAAAIKSNLEKTLLAEGFDLKTAEAGAAIVVGNETMFNEVPGLMDNIEQGFSTLTALAGEATIHRGIYRDDHKEKLIVYTILGGLDAPRERIEGLKRFLRLKEKKANS